MVSPSAALAEPSSSATLKRRLAVLAVAGAAGWATFAVMITGMMARTPPGAGFDLELLLTAGRRVAAGLSPYEPSMLAGQSVGITTLFYTYPPLVAQAFSPLASLPSMVVLAALLLAAPPLAAAVSARIVHLYDVPLSSRQVFLVALALLPFWFPFTLAVLFGNFDALFVALFGLVLLAALPAAPSRRFVLGAGAALALASVTKLHPAVLGVWLLARGSGSGAGESRAWASPASRSPAAGRSPAAPVSLCSSSSRQACLSAVWGHGRTTSPSCERARSWT